MKSQLNSIKLGHFKNTVDCKAQPIPSPAKVTMAMSQHIGAPCNPIVKIGDLVKIGQVIGEPAGFVGAPIHASVSGKVTAIEDFILSSGFVSKAVVITSDGLNEISETVVPPVVNTKEEFLKAVRASGLVGLGGAGFPTGVKLTVKPEAQVDTLIINAAECEPYITSDNQTMLYESDLVIEGIELVKKYLEIPSAAIVVESNKPRGIAKLTESAVKGTGIKVVSVPSTYPQGAEKVMVYNATGRVIPEGKLPLDVGCIVMNVTSIAFLAKYIRTGMPLVEKVITVDGSAVKQPCNVIAPIGISIGEVLEAVGGFKEEPGKVIMGGPMMGIAVYDLGYPVLKNNNAILAFHKEDATPAQETSCIRCGRCSEVCPFDLMPAAIETAYKLGKTEDLARLKVNICMECGCCAYVCPAKRQLVATNRAAKALLTQAKK